MSTFPFDPGSLLPWSGALQLAEKLGITEDRPFGLRIHDFLLDSPATFPEPPWFVVDSAQGRHGAISITAADMVGDEPWLIRASISTDGRFAFTRITIEHYTDPDAEITVATLRKLRLGRLRDNVARSMQERERRVDILGTRMGSPSPPQPATEDLRRSGGRQPLELDYLRGLAFAYVEFASEGVRGIPNVLSTRIADRGGWARPETIRGHLTRAHQERLLVSSPGRTSKPGPDLYTSPEPPRVAGPTQTSALAADHIERIVRGLVADLGVEPATRVDELLERHIAGLRGPDVTPTMRFSVPSAHRNVLILGRLARILHGLGLDVDNEEVDRSLDRQFELVELT